jgi:hypothetical protein
MSNATNAQSNRNNNPRTQQSQTTCVHGTSNNMQYLRLPTDANATELKNQSFLNHQRLFPACNCVLS